MSKVKEIFHLNPDAIVFDELDDAIVGLSTNGNVIYDVNKIHLILYEQQKKESDEITIDDVIDYVEHNILSIHAGDFTPIFIVLVD